MNYEEICNTAMDTVHECHDRGHSAYYYVNPQADGVCGMETIGHYPVPATILTMDKVPVDLEEASWSDQDRSNAYNYWWSDRIYG
jgi:hypothetical protein